MSENVFVKIAGNTVFRLESVSMIEDKFGMALVHLESGDMVPTFIATEKFHELLKIHNIMDNIIDLSKGK